MLTILIIIKNIRIIINKVKNMKLVRFMGRSIKYSFSSSSHYNPDQSLLSNVQALKRFDYFSNFMEEMQPNLGPRAYSFAARKMAYYCVKTDFFCFNQTEKEFIGKFFTKILGLNQKLLSPTQCLNIFYFFRVSKEHSEELNINKEQIDIFLNKMVDQAVKNINFLNFNKSCDLLGELSRIKINYGIDRAECEQIILQHCLKKFPLAEDEDKVDSIFHFSSLFFNLLQKSNKGTHQQLLIKTSREIAKLVKYYHLALKLKTIDEITGNFKEIKSPTEKAEIENTFQVVLIQIRNQLNTKQGQDYKGCQGEINEIINEIQETRFEGEDLIQRIALTMSSIRKVKKTDKEKQKDKSLEMSDTTAEEKQQLMNQAL